MLVMILNIHLSAVGKFCYCYYESSSFFRRTIMQNENRLGCSIILCECVSEIVISKIVYGFVVVNRFQ